MQKMFFLIFFTLHPTSAWLIKNHYVTATGTVRCYGIPVPNVLVQLKDEDVLFDKTMKTSRTNSVGYFSLTGSGRDGFRGKPDPYIRVEYTYSGSYGKMEIEKAFRINRSDKTSHRSYSRYINFGTINFNNIHCKSYVTFYNALKDFRDRAGINIPVSTLHVRTGAIVHGGTAFALLSTINIPKSYSSSQVTDRLAKHEIGHIARHSLDGNLPHFLFDVVRFWYMRSHHCGTRSNNGYAFNEGWAEYWANQCHGNYGSRSTLYNYEGNVAKALRKLISDCQSSDQKFINVLKDNRRKIHSFTQFNDAHYRKYSCKL